MRLPRQWTQQLRARVVITEWMHNPVASTSEFVQVTNIGGEPVSMAGYSFDDDSRTAGTFSLAGLGTLAPGESGLIVETSAAAFRNEWGLAPAVKIAENNTANLGRSDEINVFDGPTLADRLTYGDQTFVGSIRTQGRSGIPTSCVALGANNVGGWQFSAVGDGKGSKASVSGDIGSPGTSPLDACGSVTIVGGNGTGNPNTLPCQPEAASGTGPAPTTAQTWPGGATVAVADQACAWKTTTGPEGRDMSGLVFDPTNPNVLWAAKNKSWVFRLVKQGDLWVPDTANGWSTGKQIFFPGGVGQPDSEGLTVGGDGALYVTSERDNANNQISLDSILRFDPSAASATLIPTTQWNLTADFPELLAPGKANLGFEGVTFVPDTYLVQNGFVDQSTGSVYYPSDYPGHGAGLFFAALENDGRLYASLLKVDPTGVVVPDDVYTRPSGLPNVNIEGFAIAPASTCVNGARQAVWSDDGISATGHEGHALYSGTLSCGLDLGDQGAPAAVDLGARGPGDVSAAKKGKLHVHGSGFAPGETVRIELHDKKKVDVLASVVADASGLAIADVDIPAGVQPGGREIWLVAPSATVTAPVSITTPAAKHYATGRSLVIGAAHPKEDGGHP